MRVIAVFCVIWCSVNGQSIADYESNNIFGGYSQDFVSNDIPTGPIVEDMRSKTESKETTQMEPAKLTQIDNLSQLFILNPCVARTCEQGAMCVVTSEDETLSAYNRTKCMCPTQCDNVEEAVCSKHGITYKNKCFLHMEACKRKENIEVEYEGECIAKSGTCTPDDMSLFTPRFMEWMQMVREEYLYGEVNMNTNMLPEHQQQHIVEWMFKYLDENKDNVIGPREITTLLNYLMSVEHCVTDFISECDLDGNKHIFLAEWKICMVSGSNSVEDTFFDNNI